VQAKIASAVSPFQLEKATLAQAPCTSSPAQAQILHESLTGAGFVDFIGKFKPP